MQYFASSCLIAYSFASYCALIWVVQLPGSILNLTWFVLYDSGQTFRNWHSPCQFHGVTSHFSWAHGLIDIERILDRNSMGWIVCSPLSNLFVELTVELTILTNRLLISLITFFFIVMIESVELTPTSVVMVSFVSALLHLNHRRTFFIWYASLIFADDK